MQKNGLEDVWTSVTALDDLSNSVIDLIASGDFEKAQEVCRKLRQQYPDQVDGIWRLAMVHEARGERTEAAKLYREAADFMRLHEGFDEESIAEIIESARRMEAS